MPGHSHNLSKDLYEHLPRQRRLTEDLREHSKDVLRLKANTKMLQQEIESTTGHPVTLKDIANLRAETKKKTNSNDLEEVIQYLKSKDGSVVDIIVDQENNFKCLLYQDQYMQNMYSKFPELIMVDATYKLLSLRMPVYLLLAIDGEGLSEIVALFIVSEETDSVITSAVESFKKHNPNWGQTVTIISDKDFNERQAFTKCFPHAKLSLCLFHTLRTFKREVTIDKMGITSGERLRCLEILTQIVYSKSPAEYEQNLQLLKATKIQSVNLYFEENWQPIKEQFVTCYKNAILNFGETTNNRLESTNAKIKSVCSKHSSLLQFFNEMFTVLGALRNERRHRQLMALSCLSTAVTTDKEDMRKYRDLLTPYAYIEVKKQADLGEKVKVKEVLPDKSIIVNSSINSSLKVSSSTCECNFTTKMGLPCRHILKARSVLNMSHFDVSLVSKRWTKEYYRTATKIERPIHTCKVEVGVTHIKEEKKNIVLTQAEKFRKSHRLAQALASIVSEGGMMTFSDRMTKLQKLLNLWKAGKEIQIIENNKPVQSFTDKPQQNANLTPKGLETEQNAPTDDLPKKRHIPMNEKSPCLESKNKIKNTHTSTNSTTTCSNTSNCFPHINNKTDRNTCTRTDRNDDTEDFDTLKKVKMPHTMLKRGRPKGCEITVIGIPKKKLKKSNNSTGSIQPFCKIRAEDKDCILLECFVQPSCARKAMNGQLVTINTITSNVHSLPDMIKDESNVDIHRIEKYFTPEAWVHVLQLFESKKKCKWTCPGCRKAIKSGDSISCDRCLNLYHMSCTTLNKMPKKINWFCRPCISKHM